MKCRQLLYQTHSRLCLLCIDLSSMWKANTFRLGQIQMHPHDPELVDLTRIPGTIYTHCELIQTHISSIIPSSCNIFLYAMPDFPETESCKPRIKHNTRSQTGWSRWCDRCKHSTMHRCIAIRVYVYMCRICVTWLVWCAVRRFPWSVQHTRLISETGNKPLWCWDFDRNVYRKWWQWIQMQTNNEMWMS